jgi:hypothetical protein
MRSVQCIDCALCEGSGLVEAALLLFCAVQRNGNDEQFSGRIGDKLSDCRRKNGAQTARSGMDAVVLQGVKSSTHAAIVGTE